MYATRSLFVLLLVICASSLLVAGQDVSLDSFMEKMSDGMDQLNSQMQSIKDMLMGSMSRGMDGLTSRMKDISGSFPDNMNFDVDGLTSQIKSAGENMMNSVNDRMSQGSDFFSGQLMPQFQELSDNMKSLLPKMTEL